MKCPVCKGEGYFFEPILYNGIGGGETWKCEYCNGAGKVSIFKYIRYYANIFIWEILRKLWKTLRRLNESKRKKWIIKK